MKNKVNLNPRILVLVLIILTAALSRLIPHMHNFSPIGAICLFGAAFFKSKWKSFVVPLLATWISDLYINNVIYAKYFTSFTWFHSGALWSFSSYIVIILFGSYQEGQSLLMVLITSMVTLQITVLRIFVRPLVL